MSANKKNGKDIPVDYLEEENQVEQNEIEEDQTSEASESKKSAKQKKEKENYKKLYEDTLLKYQQLNEQFLRFRAEFANFKKRQEKEQLDYNDYIRGEIIKKILPVLDDFKHMLEKSSNETDEKTIYEGSKLMQEKFIQILTSEGLEKIESEGEEFDPQVHEAMMVQKISDEKQHNKVITVFQDGYKLKERLLRPAKVIVGNFDESDEK